MLVLTRHSEETVVINDNIEITVVEIRGDKVRLGFTAPLDIQIHRKEVYNAIKRDGAIEKLSPEEPQTMHLGRPIRLVDSGKVVYQGFLSGCSVVPDVVVFRGDAFHFPQIVGTDIEYKLAVATMLEG